MKKILALLGILTSMNIFAADIVKNDVSVTTGELPHPNRGWGFVGSILVY